MSDSLVLTYRSPVPDVTDSWLRIVREEHSLAVDAADSAALIDAIYQLDGCSDDQTELPDDLADNAGIVGPLAEEIYDTEVCTLTQERTATVRIYRSHSNEEYTLRTFAAEASDPEIVTEHISANHPIDNAAYLLLDKPVVGGFSYQWRGRVSTAAGFIAQPQVSRIGNLLYWPAAVAGILQVSYRSVYDKVVLTFPTEDNPPDAELIAFYRGTATRETVAADAVESLDYDSTTVACAGSSGSTALTEHDMTCYEEVAFYRSCSCSGDKSYSHTVERGVGCPEWFDGSNTSDQRLLVGRRDVEYWSNCGEADSCSTVELYQELCCESPPDDLALPTCCEITSNFPGVGIQTALRRELESRYPAPAYELAIIPVGPPPGEPCGNDITTQRRGTSNCCEGIEQLAFLPDESAEVIADNSFGVVAFSGGRTPVKITVYGNGFYLDERRSKKSALFNGSWVTIYTSDACGTCRVVADDGCSVAEGMLMSANGQWVLDYSNQYGGINGYNLGGINVDARAGGCPTTIETTYFYGLRVLESRGWKIQHLYNEHVGYYYGAFSAYDDAVSYCQTWRGMYEDYNPYKQTGSCFYQYPGRSDECGECHIDGGITNIRTADIEFRNTIFYDDESGLWTATGEWPLVSSTSVWRWEC